MKTAKAFLGRWALVSTLTVAGWFGASATRVEAQGSPGNKTVWKLNAQNQAVTGPSVAWIDASAFWITAGTQPDLCVIINGIFSNSYSSNYPNGAVIDARGLYNPDPVTGKSTIACTGTPFDYLIQNGNPPPTTILLPAANIPISSTWMLPNNVKISGLGGNSDVSATLSTSGNTVIAVSANFNGNELIDMGSQPLCKNFPNGCSGVVVEHLFLDASSTEAGKPLNGIVNNWSQAQSYVNDVELNNVALTGLEIGAASSSQVGAANSGPYSNIYFVDLKGSTGVCVDIETQTRGLHGISCIGGSSTAGEAGIYVNASNNTIEDVHLETFYDGIQIGDVASPSIVGNVVVSNVDAANNGSGPVQNVVHICGGQHSAGPCNNTTGQVTDITVLQARFQGTPPSGTAIVEDDVTGTTIPTIANSANTTAIYALGEKVGGVGFSRFSTSPGAPSWGVGNEPNGVAGKPCTTPGALYSNTAGGVGMSVYVCTYGLTWMPIA